MFDDFKDSQELVYNIIINSVKKNRISHAYLVDGNNNSDGFSFVMALVKLLVCDNNFTNYDNCLACNKCMRIDCGSYLDVKIIESDGLFIKKEQLIDLQAEFSKDAIEGTKKIYVIKDCDKMNKQASNCLLKFLEEPVDNIIAILFTNNIHKLLPTIISRCQLLRLSKPKNIYNKSTIVNFASFCCNSDALIASFVNDEKKKNMINNIVEFIDYYENNGLDTFIYLKKLWYNNFLDRTDYDYAMVLIINFYFDCFKYMVNINNYFFGEFKDSIERISNLNTLDSIMKKINYCINVKELLRNNLNLNLVMDDLLIGLEEINNECC